jgi:hypothetical protein
MVVKCSGSFRQENWHHAVYALNYERYSAEKDK